MRFHTQRIASKVLMGRDVDCLSLSLSLVLIDVKSQRRLSLVCVRVCVWVCAVGDPHVRSYRLCARSSSVCVTRDMY